MSSDTFKASDGWRCRKSRSGDAFAFCAERGRLVCVEGYGHTPEAAEAAAVKAWNEATAPVHMHADDERDNLKLDLAAAEARIAALERSLLDVRAGCLWESSTRPGPCKPDARRKCASCEDGDIIDATLKDRAPLDALREFGERVAASAMSCGWSRCSAKLEPGAYADECAEIVRRHMGEQREAQ